MSTGKFVITSLCIYNNNKIFLVCEKYQKLVTIESLLVRAVRSLLIITQFPARLLIYSDPEAKVPYNILTFYNVSAWRNLSKSFEYRLSKRQTNIWDPERDAFKFFFRGVHDFYSGQKQNRVYYACRVRD